MSYVFEGVVTRESRKPVMDFLDPKERSTYAEIPVGKGLTVLSRKDVRTTGFSGDVDKIASVVSAALDRALVVRYDSRTGDRSSVLFRKGCQTSAFGPKDELYAALDESGHPAPERGLYRESELSQEAEYETVKNAIQLGLEEMGACSWEQMLHIMHRATVLDT